MSVPDRGIVVHELKSWPPYFAAVLDGRKPFEVREDDRDFRVGDIVYLREYDPAAPWADNPAALSVEERYTGRELTARISYCLPLLSVPRMHQMYELQLYVILGLSDVKRYVRLGQLDGQISFDGEHDGR